MEILITILIVIALLVAILIFGKVKNHFKPTEIEMHDN